MIEASIPERRILKQCSKRVDYRLHIVEIDSKFQKKGDDYSSLVGRRFQD
jgi:hypothetical protein